MICLVGGLRSFKVPAVHNSIFQNVYQALGGTEHVDLYSITVKADNPLERGRKDQHAKTCGGETKNDFVEQLFPTTKYSLQVPASNCKVYQQVLEQEDNVTSPNQLFCPDSDVDSTGAWLQMAWLKRCFSKATKEYDWYIRVRPDMYFDKPVPDLTTLAPTTIYTSPKWDAPGSDQFFMMSKQLFQSWWLSKVEKMQSYGCCPEFTIFNGAPTNMTSNFGVCLARNLVKCDSWDYSTLRHQLTLKYRLAVQEQLGNQSMPCTRQR
jgi:hypothetical protein